MLDDVLGAVLSGDIDNTPDRGSKHRVDSQLLFIYKMFSFSKVVALGLVALSSVRAIPFMQTSCRVDFGTSVGPTFAFNEPTPGVVYHIINVATDGQVWATAQTGRIAITAKGESSKGAYAEWEFKEADQGGFKITNVGVRTSVFSENGDLFTGYVRPAETFAVESAGPGEFIIKEVARDEEWTAEYTPTPFPELRLAPSKGLKEQKWRLTPVSK
ncbi:hypothetical protein GGX14DRAFT_579496 [Mycena pura]|uniref:Uncharacterized protein n=1 Tax=Mycena pura TaxID=153505 RepID=A0AAD6UN08_9AGAR|nr:hypothetical protein GGX14DRAFT_579496 [Mycena pura]